MAKYFKTKQAKKRTIAAMSVALAATFSLGLFAACATPDDDGDEDDSTTSKTDTQLIANGNFEFYSDDDLLNLINTPDSWTRSTGSDSNGSAPSSEAASGIVNTDEWDNLTKSAYAFTSVEDAVANWDKGNAYDRIKFYEEFDIDSEEDFELYEDYKYTIDADDIPDTENPLTHDYDAEAEDQERSVLMIHNQKITNSTVYGTAQYYTSSTTVTLAADTGAEVSVWVKTADLVHYNEQEATTGCGAYIAVTNTVGGTTLDQMQIKNINTEQLNPDGDNNGWVEYKVYLRANTFADTTFKIVLGLGMGSTSDMYETVNGYAFFDDLTCKILSAEEYATATASLAAEYTCDANSAAEEKKFVATKDNTTYALDLYADFLSYTIDETQFDKKLTEEVYGDRTYTSENYRNLGLGNAANNIAELTSVTALRAQSGNSYLSSVLAKDFEKYPFDEDAQVLMLLSSNGAAYTATVKDATNFVVEPDEHLLVSFFVKTSAMNGFTGAGVSVVDGDTKTTISSLDSTTLDPVDIDEERKDIYDGWTQCFFFLSNDTDEAKEFYLEFTYGPTAIVGTTAESYTDGYAAFANFRTYSMSSREASYASTGDRAKAVSLVGDYSSASSSFDSVINNHPDSIEKDIADPANFWGVVGGHKRVGGDDTSEVNTTPENVWAGLVNKDYTSAYEGKDWQTALLEIAATQKGILSEALTADWWNAILGTAEQPLLIVNKAEAAYGYLARASASVSTSSYQEISVRVKVSDGAKAYVYLIDASDLKEKGYEYTLTPDMPDVTYWYDDDGNICVSDPSDEDFDSKTDIAYYLNKNGLYESADEADTDLYANLANYATDDRGNLVTDEGTIAFFAHEGQFYAYGDEDEEIYSVPVKDLDHSIARYDYTDAELPGSVIVVDGTQEDVANKWVTVSFFIRTGNEAKDYRLEVWSGSRDGSVKNPAGSYVVFDNKTSADVSGDFETLRSEAVETMKKEQGVGKDENLTADAFYYTYTFYDDTSYLRYDVAEDEDETGDPYEAYTQSSYSETLVYLYHEDTTSVSGEYLYQMFLDYSATDVTVEAATSDDTTDDDTTDGAATTPEYNVWLFVSSIALVAALFIVVISLGIRRITKNVKEKRVEKKARTNVAYSGKRKVFKKAPEQKEAPEEPEQPEPKDDGNPYND